MAPIQKTGLAYPNKFGVILVRALEEVMGRNGLNAILNLAGLNHYVEHPLPDNLEKGFDFAEVAAVNVVNVKGKEKRHGRFVGRRRDVKKAYVSLKGEGDINFVEGVA